MAFDDGGFFFIYDDPVRNKAGVGGKDRAGRERYFSYGSTTADGWRALLLCGLTADHPRVAAAKAWMEANFRVDLHPGKYAEERELNRGAVYFYYCCSVAQTLLAAQLPELEKPDGKVRWARNFWTGFWTSSVRTAPGSIRWCRSARTIRWWPLPLPPRRSPVAGLRCQASGWRL
jgi:hypothetical protein